MDKKWEWFCGVNSTYVDEFYSEWYSDIRNNTCLVDGGATIPHAAFLLLGSLVLLILGCFTSYRRVHTKFLLTYPGHSVRWLVSVLLLVIIVTSIGEGIMTDERYQAWDNPTQPHLYIHGIVAFVAVFISLIYYHHMELWQCPSMSLLLLAYWVLSLGDEVFRMVSLKFQGETDVYLVIFDLTMIKIAIYSVLIIIEMNLVRMKVVGCCDNDFDFNKDLQKPGMLYMQYYVSFFSALSFWWVSWLLNLGYKKHLELKDLGVVPERHEAKFNHEMFRKAFLEEQERAQKLGQKPSLFRVYIKVYGWKLFGAAILKIVGEMFFFINPIAVGALTSYVIELQYPSKVPQDNTARHVKVEEFFGNGFVLVGVMFLTSMVNFLSLQTQFYITIIEGVNVRAAIQTMVYEKTLKLSTVATTGGLMSMGQITNHMSVDPNAIQFMFMTFNNLWAIPIQLIVNLVLLYVQMGYPALIGASMFFLVSPIQIRIAAWLGKQQKQLLIHADSRLKNTNELLQGIKLLKMYAWEELYCTAIEIIRGKELKMLRDINVGFVATILLTLTTPVLVTIVGFGTYNALTGDNLTPEVTFSALSLFNMLTMPLMMLPMSLLTFINGMVSTKRVSKFLNAPEIEDPAKIRQDRNGVSPHAGPNDLTVAYQKQGEYVTVSSASELDDEIHGTDEKSTLLETNKRPQRKKNGSRSARYGTSNSHQDKHVTQKESPQLLQQGVAIKISNGSFQWDPDANTPTISDINVEIPEGKLTIIIGQVGCGKSSLLSAILGEMTTISGTVQIKDRNQIALAAQKPWLLNERLQDNIVFNEPMDARRYKKVIDACSLKPDIDILPAGDQTEIGEKGINLSGGQKQRVSVARTMYSGKNIVILDDPLSALDVHVGGHLFNEGITKLLVGHRQTVVLVTHQLQYLNKAELIIKMKDGKIDAQGTLDDIIAADPDMYSEYNRAVKLVSESEADLSGNESDTVREERQRLQQQVKTVELKRQQSLGQKGSLMVQEEIERGAVSYTMYLCYLRNFTFLAFVLSLLFHVGSTGFAIGTNFWLSDWSESGLTLNNTDSQMGKYFGPYVALSMGNLICKLIATGFIVYGILRAARVFHHGMIQNIIRVPLRFFDTTPIGRVLNRFSSDMQLIDTKMGQTIHILLGTFLNLCSSVIVNTIVMPIFLVFFIPICVVYIILQRYFIASSRELQRLDSISKSPVFAYFSESLNGITTIRAFSCTKRFYDTVVKRINTNLAAFLYLQLVNRWLAIRLDFLGALVVLTAGLTTLSGALLLDVSPSLVGLAVTYTLQVSGFMNFFVRMVTELEMQMNAVERVSYYTAVPNEHYEGHEPPPDWPQTGRIELENVSVRYAQDTDTVLRDITVEFKAGQKIGVCGRTGAGKSSLTLALLRVVDIFEGQILIDGIDIMSIPLTTLRGKLSIIPQDPVLFTGTIRRNLDPIGHVMTDKDLWNALEISQLKDVVSALDGGLEFKVTEGGENFSVGQRQLFCLARAFLRKSRVLIMDEATASIDMETDKILQKVVTTAFADRTVLTIAHRITTIMNSDNILVLEEGRVAEFGSPDELMQKDGIFASFVHNMDQ